MVLHSKTYSFQENKCFIKQKPNVGTCAWCKRAAAYGTRGGRVYQRLGTHGHLTDLEERAAAAEQHQGLQGGRLHSLGTQRGGGAVCDGFTP